MKHEASITQPITRRDFLKTSTVAAPAAAIGTLDLSRSAHAAGSDIISLQRGSRSPEIHLQHGRLESVSGARR